MTSKVQNKPVAAPTASGRLLMWSLVGVFAPTIISLAAFKWGGYGLQTLEALESCLKTPVAIRESSAVSLATSGNGTATDLDLLRAEYAQACPQQQLRTAIFSTDPLIIYIENYLAPAEVNYLLQLAVPLYEKSPLSKGHILKTYDAEIRSSMSAVLPLDPVVQCIEKRSADFQGFLPNYHIEDIQVVKYGAADYFRPHYDWFAEMENKRISTFFVYLACDSGQPGVEGECKGGATQFPNFEGRFPARWCEFIDCQDESGVGGVGFKPIVGNALFWRNFYANGTGHPGVWHAGMPVTEGRKVGLNIFTRENKVESTESGIR